MMREFFRLYKHPVFGLLVLIAFTGLYFSFYGTPSFLLDYLEESRAVGLYIFLENQGESLGLVLAVIAGGLAYFNALWLKSEDDREKRKTARYWIFYNAANRLRQDEHIAELLTGVFNTPDFKAAIHARPENSDHESQFLFITSDPSKLIARLAEALTRAEANSHEPSELIRRRLHNILQGYSDSWKNDDLLERIVFEFSLLKPKEQEETLKYCSRYSAMQDRVSSILPHLNDAQTAGGQEPTVYCVRTYQIYLSILNAMVLGCNLVNLLLRSPELAAFQDRGDELNRLMDDCALFCILPNEMELPEEGEDVTASDRFGLKLPRYIQEPQLRWLEKRKAALSDSDAPPSA